MPAIAMPGLNGKAVKLAGFRGKPVVICLLGSWANPSFPWLPALQAADHELSSRMTFLHLHVEPDLAGASQARDRYGLAGTHAWLGWWEDTTVLAEWGIETIPSVVLVDAAGRLKTRVDSFENLIEALNAE